MIEGFFEVIPLFVPLELITVARRLCVHDNK